MFLLGGHGLMLGPQDIQLGVNESMKDTGIAVVYTGAAVRIYVLL